MVSPLIDHVKSQPEAKDGHCPDGFSLLEMMMVVTLILIIASVATPIYRSVVVRAREAVLRDDLYSLRFLIDRFTVDPSADGPLARAPG